MDSRAIYAALDRLRAKGMIDCIIEGGCLSGADSIARNWAETNGIECRTYVADWERHGRAAGPMRNQLMLDREKPDGVIAFPGGRGTEDMKRRALAAHVKIWEPCT